MTNAEEFIEEYKILEKTIKDKFNLENYESALVKLSQQPQFRHLKNDLDYLRDIRNLLQHEPTINGAYPIEPNKELTVKIKKIIELINNPPKAYDKCIRINDICFANWSDLIFPFMKKMQENVYTHIPILENGIVAGVFSENTLFEALIDEEIFFDKTRTTFDDTLIKKFCNIEKRGMESFKFISKDTYLENVKDMFKNTFKEQERLSMLFITQNGRPNEKLLGILTPWDVLQ